MKSIHFSLLICLLFLAPGTYAQILSGDYLFDLDIHLDPPQFVGPVTKGLRLISPFRDGVIQGENIKGKILPCSGDWGLVLDSETFKVDSRATIETTEGTLIYITYTGYSYATAKVASMIGAGKVSGLSPSDYYFRVSVSFETNAKQYAWLNHTIGIGVGRFPAPGEVAFRIYAVR